VRLARGTRIADRILMKVVGGALEKSFCVVDRRGFMRSRLCDSCFPTVIMRRSTSRSPWAYELDLGIHDDGVFFMVLSESPMDDALMSARYPAAKVLAADMSRPVRDRHMHVGIVGFFR